MKQRIITAIIAALIFLPIVFYGGLPLVLLIYIMATVSLFEILRMRKITKSSVPSFLSVVLLWLFLLPIDNIHLFSSVDLTGKIEWFLFGILIFLSYSVISKNSFSFEDVAFSVLAIVYIGTGFFYLMETRVDGGIVFVFFALLLIWATDSGAYFIGRAIGKRKLAPHISPNKTVEGSIGGVLCAIGISLIFYFFSNLGEDIGFTKLVLVSVVLSVFGQFGDLVESALKRYYGVKDSGNILPGHGGILDRVDSWLFVMPLLHFLQLL